MLFNNNKLFAFLSCALFSLNPGNIFFSATYSESLYSMLTFTALYYLYSDQVYFSSMLFFLSCLTRSNGILNSGFLLYFLIRNYFKSMKISSPNLISLFRTIIQNCISISLVQTLKLVLNIIFVVLFMLSAFLSYQYYIYLNFCSDRNKSLKISNDFVKYAQLNDYNLITDRFEWCNNSMPLSYGHVQSTYWNVGFLKYWQLKQIPNFILASPLLFVSIKGLSDYFKSMDSNNLFNLFGLVNSNKVKNFKTFQHNHNVHPFAIHLIALLVSSLFFMHVQVI